MQKPNYSISLYFSQTKTLGSLARKVSVTTSSTNRKVATTVCLYTPCNKLLNKIKKRGM